MGEEVGGGGSADHVLQKIEWSFLISSSLSFTILCLVGTKLHFVTNYKCRTFWLRW